MYPGARVVRGSLQEAVVRARTDPIPVLLAPEENTPVRPDLRVRPGYTTTELSINHLNTHPHNPYNLGMLVAQMTDLLIILRTASEDMPGCRLPVSRPTGPLLPDCTTPYRSILRARKYSGD
ncbi:hypothetical protein R1flu_014547 [Riccia fluitans]|uniref:Uncharacterized protein n=1 Tax=Riccia fluitans TaxID=41844 RepID=A0ABD1YGE4_9MARC